MKKIATISNVEFGTKVKRGPAWKYKEQDRGSDYGIVVNPSPMDGVTNVAWIHPDKTTNLFQAVYRLARNDEDIVRADLVLYDEEEGNLPKDGEQVLIKKTDSSEVWNNAVESIINIATDFPGTEAFINKIYDMRREPEKAEI